MAMPDELFEHLNHLENLLVQEFRASQTLFNLTRDERAALSSSNVEFLLSVVDRKEALLDEMSQLDDARRMVTQKLKTYLEPEATADSLVEIVTCLEPETAKRVVNLRSGILALLDKVRELTYGNRVLATSALERADAVQSFLLNLLQPASDTYRPQGTPKVGDVSLAWEVDHSA